MTTTHEPDIAILSAASAAMKADGGYNDRGARAKVADWEATFFGMATAIPEMHQRDWTNICFIRFDSDGIETKEKSFPRAFAVEGLPGLVQLDETRRLWPLELPDGFFYLVLTDEETWHDKLTGRTGTSWQAQYVARYDNESQLTDGLRDLKLALMSLPKIPQYSVRTADEIRGKITGLVADID